jgi:hypothetical protein
MARDMERDMEGNTRKERWGGVRREGKGVYIKRTRRQKGKGKEKTNIKNNKHNNNIPVEAPLTVRPSTHRPIPSPEPSSA